MRENVLVNINHMIRAIIIIMNMSHIIASPMNVSYEKRGTDVTLKWSPFNRSSDSINSFTITCSRSATNNQLNQYTVRVDSRTLNVSITSLNLEYEHECCVAADYERYSPKTCSTISSAEPMTTEDDRLVESTTNTISSEFCSSCHTDMHLL